MKHNALSSHIKNLAIVAALMLPFSGFAQSLEPVNSEKNFRLGFTTSPTFGWLKYDAGTDRNDGLRTGFAYGVLGDFGFSDNYYFSTGLTVTSLNANVESIPTTSAQASSAYKLQYLEVPLTLKLKSNRIQNNRFYGQFGLAGNIKIGAKQDGTVVENGTTTRQLNNENISSSINNFRLGLVFGGGAEWSLGENVDLLTGLSYNNGLTDIFDTNAKAKNSYISVNLGVFF